MNRVSLFALLLVAGGIVAAIEAFAVPKSDATLIVTLTFFTMLVQGCVALAAVGELAKGIWMIPIKRELLSAYPMLFILAVLTLLMGLRMDEVYAWSDHPTVWLEHRFFVLRNVLLILLCFWAGRGLAGAVMKDTAQRGLYAALYVFFWVVSQSLVAFDWVMSLEYPWISTLFGGWFFVQSFIMGLLFSVFVIVSRRRGGEKGLTETLRDTAKMTLGFCFMWAGFFFAQYLVIWYGNIGEEVAYVLKRQMVQPYRGMSLAMLLMVFAIPFFTLVFRKVKVMHGVMLGVALTILTGFLIKLLVLVAPVRPVSPVWLALEFVVLLAAFVLMVKNRDLYMPQPVKSGAGDADTAGGLAHAHRT